MNIVTWIAVITLALALTFSVKYIVKEKRRGAKCIGCPFAGECAKCKHNIIK